MLPLLLALLSPPAAAAVVVQPDRHQAEVTVVFCPVTEGCEAAMRWLDSTGHFDANVLSLDTITELERGGWRGGEALAETFARSIAAARKEALAGRWAMVQQTLEQAEEALAEWPGSPENHELFALYYLRAALSRSLAGDGAPERHLEQAAAVAWNRQVELPLPDPALRREYYHVLDRLLAKKTGRLQVREHASGAQLSIDGVPVGKGPVEVALLPGRHRVSAMREDAESGWATDLVVYADETTITRPRFSILDDPAVVHLDISAVFDTRAVRPEVAELLDSWCERYAVRGIRFVEIEPVSQGNERVRMQDGSLREVERQSLHRLRVVRYRPGVQAWVPGEVPILIEGVLYE